MSKFTKDLSKTSRELQYDVEVMKLIRSLEKDVRRMEWKIAICFLAIFALTIVLIGKG